MRINKSSGLEPFASWVYTHRWVVGVWALFLVHAGINTIRALSNPSSEGVDVANHLLYALEFHDGHGRIWTDSGVSPTAKLEGSLTLFQAASVYWPRLLYFFSVPFLSLFGRSILAFKLSIQPFLLLLMLSTYGIGKHLGGARVGFFSALLVSLCPLVFEASRQYGLDLPLTAFVALSVLLLIRSQQLTRIRYTVLLGWAIGFGMLFKGQLVIFLFWPVAFVAMTGLWNRFQGGRTDWSQSWKRRFHPLWRFVLTLVLVLTVAAIPASLHWGPKLAPAVDELALHAADNLKAMEGTYSGDPGTPAFYFWHLAFLFGHSAGPPLFVLSIIGFLSLLRRRRRSEVPVLLLLTTVPGLVVFSLFLGVKQGRFLMPVMPFLAIATATLLWRPGTGAWLKPWRIGFLSYYGLVFLVLTFGAVSGLDVERLRELNSGDHFPAFSLLPSTGYWDSMSPPEEQVACDALYAQVADVIASGENHDAVSSQNVGLVIVSNFQGFYRPSLIIGLRRSGLASYDILERAELFFAVGPSIPHVVFLDRPGREGWSLSAELQRRFEQQEGVCEANFRSLFEDKNRLRALDSFRGEFVEEQRFGNACGQEAILYKRGPSRAQRAGDGE